MKKAKVIEAKLFNPRLLHLKIEADVDFKPGQFIMLKRPDYEVKRSYSIANSPFDRGYLEFVIRINENGKLTPKLKELKEGDEVEYDGPFGKFIFKEEDRETLFIAGGAGISPIRSMLRYAIRKGTFKQSKFWLFFGFNTVDDFIFREEFEGYDKDIDNFTFVASVLEPPEGWKYEVGFVMPAIEKRFESLAGKVAYLCGPPPMVKAVREFLERMGMSKEDINFEQW